MRKRNIVVAATTVLVAACSVAIGAAALAAPAARVVKACVKSDGQIRIVSAHVKRCSQGRHLLVWNVTGPRGPAGPPGPQGSPGPAPVTTVQTMALTAGTATYTVLCPAANQTAISGGWVLGAEPAAVTVTSDRRDPANPRAWILTFAPAPTVGGAGTVAEAICLSPGPPVT